MPKGFKLTGDIAGSAWIEYCPPEVSGPARFFMIWVVLVSIGFIGSTYEVYRKFNSPASFMRYLANISWLGWLVAITVMMLMLGLPAIALGWFLFGKSRFGLSENGLSVQKRLFFWQRTRFVPRDTMLRFTQIKDGGSRGKIRWSDDDSFPTWGLILNVRQDMNVPGRQFVDGSSWSERFARLDTLLTNHSIDKSELPGTVLARWATEQDLNLLAKEPIDKSDWLGMVLSEKYNFPFVPSQERE